MHQKEIDPDKGKSGLPGLFFMFDISPLVVQLSEEQ
jgi:hypothetical protein